MGVVSAMNRKVNINPVPYEDLYSYDFASTKPTNQCAWIASHWGVSTTFVRYYRGKEGNPKLTPDIVRKMEGKLLSGAYKGSAPSLSARRGRYRTIYRRSEAERMLGADVLDKAVASGEVEELLLGNDTKITGLCVKKRIGYPISQVEEVRRKYGQGRV